MLGLALFFFIAASISAIFSVGGLAPELAGLAHDLLLIFVGLFAAALALGLLRGRPSARNHRQQSIRFFGIRRNLPENGSLIPSNRLKRRGKGLSLQ